MKFSWRLFYILTYSFDKYILRFIYITKGVFMYLLVAKQLIIMSLISVVSYFFSKKKKYGENESKFLSNLLLFVISPCLILNTFTIPYSVEKIKAIGSSALISVITLSFLVLLSIIFVHSKTEIGKSRDRFDKVSFVYSNAGFIGIPLINGVFGAEGVFLLMGYIVIYNSFLWTHGIGTVTGKINFKQILTNPNILAIIIGVIIFVTPIQIPSILAQTVKIIGDLNTAVSMIILGLLFANFKKPEKGEKTPALRIGKVILFRLIILPIALLILYKVLHTFIFVTPAMFQIMMIIFIAASCPVGMSVANFAVIFGKEESYCSLLVAISSVFCVVSLPLMVKVAELFL